MKRLVAIQLVGCLCLLSCGEAPPAAEGPNNIDHNPLVKGGVTIPRKHNFLGTFTSSTGDWTLKQQRPGWPDGSYVDSSGTLQPGVIGNVVFRYGNPNDTPLFGDWDGNGFESQGVWRQGTFFLANNLGGPADLTFSYQLSTDVPVVGDWNGDGTTTVGVYRNGTFLLRNSNTAGAADITFAFGLPGDIPLAGDWDGDGTDNVGVYRPSNATFYLSYAFTSNHQPDIVFSFGNLGATPIVGDWNEDGVWTVGIVQSNYAFLSNSMSSGIGEIAVPLGTTGDIPIAGNWNVNVPTGLSTTPASLTNFFPLGVWVQPASSFTKWQGRGINTIVNSDGTDTMDAWTTAANQLSLKMIRGARPNPADDLREGNLLGWLMVDEPDLNGTTQVPQLRAQYQAWRSYNSTIPILVDLAGDHIENPTDQFPGTGVSRGPDACSGPGDYPTDMSATACYPTYLGLTDWVLHDYYPINANRDVTVVAGMMDKMMRWSSKPQFPFVEAAGAIYSPTSPPPSADQMRAEIWLAIIHGARGITYFTWGNCPNVGWCADNMNMSPTLITEMTAQNLRITGLASVIQGAINPPSIGFRSGVPLQATWRQSGMATYFFVLNVSPNTITKSMTVTGLVPSAPFTVVGENRTLPAQNTITDTFTPYQVHIYRTP